MTPTPTIPVPAPRRAILPALYPATPAEEQPAPTIRVPVHAPSGTSGVPLTPPPTSARRISRSILAAADNADDEPIGTFPRVGETFLGFELVEELGEGAFARVFLARQAALAGRLVALKVTHRPTREAERLARLQHTNVVPVYSVHDARPAQVICMPFLGRRTIADLIRSYQKWDSSRPPGSRRTSGTRAVRTTAAADSSSRSGSTSDSKRPASSRVLRRIPTDPDAPPVIGNPLAVVKVLAQLAAGLEHAHSRGILHLDLKPANVLYPDVGEPMLLDFNLSFDTTAAERDLVGGTIPYMAIEQLIDLRSRGCGQVDARTDLYSLGVMAFEMLTGTVPFPASSRRLADMDELIAARRKGPPSLRELNPAVTPAVEAIVRKLLAPNPDDRYKTAEQLRVDAERHLNDLPLLHTTEPSARERFGKWRRRNPGVFGRLAIACLLGLALGLGGVVYTRAETNARAAAIERAHTIRATLDSVRLDLVIPNDPTSRARGVARAEELLAQYGLPNEDDWTTRPEVKLLSEADRASLTADLGELLLLLARARWEAADGLSDDDRRELAANVMKLNRVAADCFPAGTRPPLLDRQAAELAAVLGQDAPASDPRHPDQKPTPRDLFLDAAVELSRGQFSTALSILDDALRLQPSHGAANFCLAYCRQQLGQTERALQAYDSAERLMPTDPRPAFQRGIIYGTESDDRHKQEKAIEEYSRVIRLAPEHPLAYRNRGFCRKALGELPEAEADFTRALELGAPAIQVYLYRARVRAKRGDLVGAAADQRAAAALKPQHEGDYIARGRDRLEYDVEGALEDFQAAARLNPRSMSALRNLVHVLADRLDRTEAALAVADRMTEVYPDYAPGRVTRAMLLARLGRRADAHAEATCALRLSPKDPGISFRVACVYALTSKTHAEDQAKALAFLEQALKDGFRDVRSLKSNRDLESLKGNKRFSEIIQALTSLFQ